jgi:hypothetical protein
MLPWMVFAAKCYWPGIAAEELARAARRAAREAELARHRGSELAYLGSILFPDDELVLCLFDGPSSAAVKETNERAGIPCERVMRSIWLEPEHKPARTRTRAVWPTLRRKESR